MHWILYAALLTGCSGGTPQATEPAKEPSTAKEPPAEVKNLKLNLEELKNITFCKIFGQLGRFMIQR